MIRRFFVAFFSLIALASCASLPPGFEAPVLSFQGFQAVNSGAVAPDFMIRVKVLNPNREALEVAGLFYTVTLEGQRLLAGVSSDLPRIPAYGEEVLQVRASVDVLGSIRLINELVQRPRSAFNYELELKLDLVGFKRPLRLEQEGLIDLNPQRASSSRSAY